ncbi:Chaperone protein TorD [Oligella sp. MSHR50489EDL]|uniref:TorD/DmsD family molecular chaperone n=1 Tax=Oligella sp. MSHR50489EDL TaxID=3139409 RepID=UPI003D81A8D5
MEVQVLRINWQSIHETRTIIYQWFSRVFADVMSPGLLAFSRDDWIPVLLKSLDSVKFAKEIDSMKSALEALKTTKDAESVLAEDFKALFLGENGRHNRPLASLYLPRKKLATLHSIRPLSVFLKGWQVPLHPAFEGMDDHLSVYLAALATWSLVLVEDVEPKELERHFDVQCSWFDIALASWVFDWLDRLLDAEGTHSNFYQSFAAIMCAFMHEDDYKAGKAGADFGFNFKDDELVGRILH